MSKLDWIFQIPWKALCVGTAELEPNHKSGTFDPSSTCGDDHFHEPLLLEMHNGTFFEIRGLKQSDGEHHALYSFEVIREIPKGEKIPGLDKEHQAEILEFNRVRKAA